MNRLNAGKKIRLILFCVVTVAVSTGQTFTTLANFSGPNGDEPMYGSLAQGFDGNLYGTTFAGGAHGRGTVFTITTGGGITVLHSFASLDGYNPAAGVVLTANGSFYGAAANGGTVTGCGTLFNITSGGTFTPLHSFDLSDGCNPYALVQATDGNFYGTTRDGGADGYGTVFTMTPEGTLTPLHSFDSSDGTDPYGALIQAANGKLYGTTDLGGANGYGTIFEITLQGVLTTLHNFDLTDGAGPIAGLTQATNGELYGTTNGGGSHGRGTVFRVALDGTLTTLHSFDSSDGAHPYGPLVQATDGNFYGVTDQGGAHGYGTIFRMAADGKLTTLHNFDSTGGATPQSGLAQGTDGNLYGTTLAGGTKGDGTVFRLSVGLGPLVTTLPSSGTAGAMINILGTNLSGATGVNFNGAVAAFTIVSSTQITATVPAGATTGRVQVTTPGGTLSSKVPFRVLP